MNFRSVDRRVRADRDLAASAKYCQEGSFGGDGDSRWFVFECMRSEMRLARVVARFNSERALADGGNHDVDGDQLRDAIGPAQAAKACGCEHNGVELSFLMLTEPGVDVASQSLYRKSAMHRFELNCPAQ